MADIRNDITELQRKVLGKQMYSPWEDFPNGPDSWRDNQDIMDTGSGEDYKDYKDYKPQGDGVKSNKKRKPTRGLTDSERTTWGCVHVWLV